MDGLIVITNHKWKKESLGVIISNDKEHQLVVSSNEYVADASLNYSNSYNIEGSDKQDIVTNI